MTPGSSRKWEYAITGFILVIASYLLIVPPIVGVADQGDYYRLVARVGLLPPAGLSTDDSYHCWVLTRWNIIPAQPIRVFSTGEFPVWAALILHKLTSRTATLDIRLVAAVHLALLLGLIVAVLRSIRNLPPAAYFVISAGLVLVFTDSEYLSYFNSFFGEAAALLGVAAFVAAGLAAVTADNLSGRHISAIVVASAFLAGSKAQNAILAVIAACWLVWLFKNKPAPRLFSILAGVALVAFSGFVLTRAPAPESNLFNAIYGRVLPNSNNPSQSVADLGLRPETTSWNRKSYWEVHIPSPDIFPGTVTRFTLLNFYLRHPLIDLRMAQESLTFSNDVPYLGNYSKESGAACLTRTLAFTEYDRLRMQFASIWFLLPLLAVNVAAAFIRPNRMASLIATVAIMAAAAFALGAFYDNEPRKHLFTFNLLVDVLLFADISVAAAFLARHRARFPLFGHLKERGMKRAKGIVAFALLVILGVTLPFDVISKAMPPKPHLAFGKPTAQSSTVTGYPTAPAQSAVDGKTGGNFFDGSVTHTNPDVHAWWQVDLQKSAPIGDIVIWNRTDCCSDRLNDYWVFVSNAPFTPADTPATLKDRPGTWSSHQIAAPDPSTRIKTNGASARYVRVQLNGANSLSLAEVQVFAK
jgi:hypothetical protein